MKVIGEQVGSWIVKKILSEDGGNGYVYEVSNGNRDAAMKVLRTFLDVTKHERRRARFCSEILKLEAFAALSKGGVMPIIDSDSESESPWFVMPIAFPLDPPADPLDRTNWVIDVALQVAHTLAGLHAEGMTHRDIKPSNMMTLAGRVVLSDFGLAYSEDDTELTATGERVGSVGFTAPESIGHSDEPRFPADVYSLAKSTWSLLTSNRTMGSLDQVHDHPSMHGIDNPVADALHGLLVAATSRDKLARPTATQFVNALESLVSGGRSVEPLDIAQLQRRAANLFGSEAERNRRTAALTEVAKQFRSDAERQWLKVWTSIASSVGWNGPNLGGGSPTHYEAMLSGWNTTRRFGVGRIGEESYQLSFVQAWKQKDEHMSFDAHFATVLTRNSVGAHVEVVLDSIDLSTFASGPELLAAKAQVLAFVESARTGFVFLETLSAWRAEQAPR